MSILNSNITRFYNKQRGVGLIEILIVLVVLVIGWAALSSLQGKLMSSTSATKLRNEALEMAREKTEELRNSIEKGQYDADLAIGSGSDTATGTTLTFNRSWTLGEVDVDADGTAEDYIKDLIVTVGWKNYKNEDESVALNTIITYLDPLKTASLASGGIGDAGGLAPPSVLTATEGPSAATSIIPGSLDAAGVLLLDKNSTTPTTTEISTGEDDLGNKVIYSGAANPSNVELTVYGGKILRFSGLIYYDSTDPFVRATSPSYCATFVVQDPVADCGLAINSGISCASYVCYAGGDCSNGGDGCPTDVRNIPDLNGGWYGKIGDFFPLLANAQNYPNICAGNPLDASAYVPNVPARFYASKREVSSGPPPVYEYEGTNTSFECQNTFISDSNNDSLCQNIVNQIPSATRTSMRLNQPDLSPTQLIRSLASAEVNDVLGSSNNTYNNGVFPNFCSYN